MSSLGEGLCLFQQYVAYVYSVHLGASLLKEGYYSLCCSKRFSLPLLFIFIVLVPFWDRSWVVPGWEGKRPNSWSLRRSHNHSEAQSPWYYWWLMAYLWCLWGWEVHLEDCPLRMLSALGPCASQCEMTHFKAQCNTGEIKARDWEKCHQRLVELWPSMMFFQVISFRAFEDVAGPQDHLQIQQFILEDSELSTESFSQLWLITVKG